MIDFKILEEGKYNKEQWRHIIKNFNPEIENKTQYCKRHNTSRSRYNYWENMLFGTNSIKNKASDFKSVNLIPNNKHFVKELESNQFITIDFPSKVKLQLPANISKVQLIKIITSLQGVMIYD